MADKIPVAYLKFSQQMESLLEFLRSDEWSRLSYSEKLTHFERLLLKLEEIKDLNEELAQRLEPRTDEAEQ